MHENQHNMIILHVEQMSHNHKSEYLIYQYNNNDIKSINSQS